MGALARGGEKAKDVKGTLRRLMIYLRPSLLPLIIVTVFAIASTIFGIAAPKILGNATDEILKGLMIGGMDFTAIRNILITVGVIYLLSALLSFVQQFIMTTVSQRIVLHMRGDVNRKLARLPLAYFDSHSHGDILSRFTNDIDTVSQTLQQGLMQLITSFVTIVGVLIMMLSISPLLTAITLVTLPLSLLITMGIAKQSQKHFRNQQNELGALNGHIEEMYSGHNVIKLYGREKWSMEEFSEINESLYGAGWKAQFMSGILMPLMNFVGNLGYVLVCIVGGMQVIRGNITLGNIQAFIQYIRQFTQPISQLANIANIIQSTIAAAERVFTLLDETEQVAETQAPQRFEAEQKDKNGKTVRIETTASGHVEFDHIRFGYTPDQTLITDMSVNVSPGQMVAIVGPTGAGKTTLVNLLMRFYDVQDGAIRIDGIDIRDLTRANLRKQFGMVLQDTWLFNGTIRENLAFGRSDASEAEIVQAAKAARVDYFIRTLSEGYDTVLGEDATNISQGQKQLLTIARAILADPPILILDEATSSVDTRTEMLIQKAMATLMKGRTSFVIAHRLSTIRDADLILVMNHGDIIEQGTHKELLDAKGFYADLYNSQFSARQAG